MAQTTATRTEVGGCLSDFPVLTDQQLFRAVKEFPASTLTPLKVLADQTLLRPLSHRSIQSWQDSLGFERLRGPVSDTRVRRIDALTLLIRRFGPMDGLLPPMEQAQLIKIRESVGNLGVNAASLDADAEHLSHVDRVKDDFTALIRGRLDYRAREITDSLNTAGDDIWVVATAPEYPFYAGHLAGAVPGDSLDEPHLLPLVTGADGTVGLFPERMTLASDPLHFVARS